MNDPRILAGDCREQLANIETGTIDAVITDPPYELAFMGKKWDASGVAFDVATWEQCLRVLKPGGHLCAFGGTRTYHRMAVAIEDAGFEIRDSIDWVYGSGFPKSLDVSKAIDKQLHAKRWQGWGTALKPAHEPIVLARKPLNGTVAANVLEHGVGALNIDGSRVGTDGGLPLVVPPKGKSNGIYGDGLNGACEIVPLAGGRWPANLTLTHHHACQQRGTATIVSNSHHPAKRGAGGIGTTGHAGQAELHERKGPETVTVWDCHPECPARILDTQSGITASRFFTQTAWDHAGDVASFYYVAKPSKRERNQGLDHLDEKQSAKYANGAGLSGRTMVDGKWINTDAERKPAANTHPTVKPVALLRHLARLTTPPGGVILDPFLGSGTTAVAATLEQCNWIGCELTADYIPIIQGRVAWAEQQHDTATPTIPYGDTTTTTADPTLFDGNPL